MILIQTENLQQVSQLISNDSKQPFWVPTSQQKTLKNFMIMQKMYYEQFIGSVTIYLLFAFILLGYLYQILLKAK